MQVENYRRKTGRVMLEDGDMMTIARDLFYAPFALLYHNNFEAPEQPLYQYANQVLCAVPGCSWRSALVCRKVAICNGRLIVPHGFHGLSCMKLDPAQV